MVLGRAAPGSARRRRTRCDAAAHLGQALAPLRHVPPALDPPGRPGLLPGERVRRLEGGERAPRVRLDDDVVALPGQSLLRAEPTHRVDYCNEGLDRLGSTVGRVDRRDQTLPTGRAPERTLPATRAARGARDPDRR